MTEAKAERKAKEKDKGPGPDDVVIHASYQEPAAPAPKDGE